MSDTVLVRTSVRIAGLRAHTVGEIPARLYDLYQRKGYVEKVDRLQDRMR